MLFLPLSSFAYSVLTHEALIDASWKDFFLPLLKKKYPNAAEQELKDARAYAYGGAVAPDMGYYPFGNALFTNLVHYVRSGDMVEALVGEAQNINQYAFALGCLCHYNADNYGHPLGVNRSVPIQYPKLKEKYGNEITYAEDKKSHLQTEFSFDVLQMARGNYANEDYHNYIGFKVDTEVLSRAFEKTYGLQLSDVFHHRLGLAVETFRWSVKDVIPFATKAAWATKKNDIKKLNPSANLKTFRYRMHRSQFRNEFGKDYKSPGFFPTVFSFIVHVLPKAGPLRALKFRTPTPQTERNYIESFDTSLGHYGKDLKQLQTRKLNLSDKDFDTGHPTEPGEYPLADKAYAQLVLELKKDDFKNMNATVRQSILNFYSNRNAKIETKKDQKEWDKVNDALKQMREATATSTHLQ